MFTTIHKHYPLEAWRQFAAEHPDVLYYMAASSGTGAADLEKLSAILEAVPGLQFICLDVANGYSEQFVEGVRKVRAAHPQHTIMVSVPMDGEGRREGVAECAGQG